ncbi:MAG: YicC family protein [Candidatus Aminicenantes bacterium]|nr:YicC family protein [Candidatus Aminicenantes bacterium]
MIQSMTGFAENSFSAKTLRVKISLKSLNHRFFDWSYKGAPLGEIENRLRAVCQEKIHRGRVEATIDMVFPDPGSWDVVINEGLLEKILAAYGRVAARSGKDLAFGLDNMFRIPQLIELRRKDFTPAEAELIIAGFKKTLDELIKSRRAEGRKINLALQVHLRNVSASVGRVGALIKKQPRALRKKLQVRLAEANGAGSNSKERMAEEVAYLSQRYDVAEEIARLKHHLDATRDLLAAKNAEPAGKMLDFLAQEFTREANTLNSKSQEIGVTREGLIIKGEVESIRQQVQNIE